MDTSDNEPHFSEREEVTASMASMHRDFGIPNKKRCDAAAARVDGKDPLRNFGHANGFGTRPSTSNISSRYRHIAAVHSRARNSSLSRDAELTPSFLGFRNLMVIVLSEHLSIFEGCNKCEMYPEKWLIKASQSCDESTIGR